MQLKRLKKLLRHSLLLLLISFGFSCVPVQRPPSVVIYLPEHPKLESCPQLVVVEGDIIGDKIQLSLADAQKLRDWIHSYIACSEANQIYLKGHIEKLENRLKTIGGV